jgi:hypothetical protein
MKAALLSAAMLSVLTASASYAATERSGAAGANPAASSGEGASGGRGVKVASAAASTFLFVREAAQSPLVTVGEGGEGRRGRRWRQQYGPSYNYYYQRDRYRRVAPRLYDRPYYGRPYGRPYYYDRPSYYGYR